MTTSHGYCERQCVYGEDMQSCVFCKIASGEIPANIIWQDDIFVAFSDLSPQAPVHVLIVPRKHTVSLMDCDGPELLGSALVAVQKVAVLLGVASDGFRTVINCRDNGGQTVPHLHFHLLGGRFMQWPPG